MLEHPTIKEKILFIIKGILEQLIVLLVPIIIIRFFDFILVKEVLFFSFLGTVKAFLIIVFKELKFLSLYLFSIGILLSVLKFWSKKLYWILVLVFTSFILFIYLFTTQYFHTAGIRIDHVILFFTVAELKQIASSETSSLLSEYLWLYLLTIISFVVAAIYAKGIAKYILSSRMMQLLIAFLLVSVFTVSFLYQNKVSFKQEAFLSSKPQYFGGSIYKYYKNKDDLDGVGQVDFVQVVNEFRSFMGWEASVYQLESPLSKKFNISDSFLLQFFDEFEEQPNLVMVFCEGLSSSFSGPQARYGSLTPNLDSIFSQSLYWPNTVSNTDRTHGVFANALASLPHGFERGMLNIRTPFPEHLSLPKLFSKNGYNTSFTYGGWGYFDNYEPFLKMNYVEDIQDEEYMKREGIVEKDKKEETFSWGVADRDLIKIYFDIKQKKPQTPFFDILLTLSLHTPFDIPNQEYYIELGKEQFDKVNGDQKLYETYKKPISTIIYQDAAIGDLMREYSKREDYENTIFLFVGDHNVRELPMLSLLESHHVPLAIFSPKLKSAQLFNDIVAHTNIPQAIVEIFLPYFDEKLLPEYNSWLGEGLTTYNKVKSEEPIFLGRFSGDIVGIINKDTLLLDDILYKIKDHLEIEELFNLPERESYYLKQLRNYRVINNYVIKDQKILTEKEASIYPNAEVSFYFPEGEN